MQTCHASPRGFLYLHDPLVPIPKPTCTHTHEHRYGFHMGTGTGQHQVTCGLPMTHTMENVEKGAKDMIGRIGESGSCYQVEYLDKRAYP